MLLLYSKKDVWHCSWCPVQLVSNTLLLNCCQEICAFNKCYYTNSISSFENIPHSTIFSLKSCVKIFVEMDNVCKFPQDIMYVENILSVKFSYITMGTKLTPNISKSTLKSTTILYSVCHIYKLFSQMSWWYGCTCMPGSEISQSYWKVPTQKFSLVCGSSNPKHVLCNLVTLTPPTASKFEEEELQWKDKPAAYLQIEDDACNNFISFSTCDWGMSVQD